MGTESIDLHEGRINTLSYTLRVIDDQITPEQKRLAIAAVDNYQVHWDECGSRLVEHFALEELNNRLLFFMPAEVKGIQYDYMFGYEFVRGGETFCSFFAYKEDSLAYIHIDKFDPLQGD